jgi:hypothetical protein
MDAVVHDQLPPCKYFPWRSTKLYQNRVQRVNAAVAPHYGSTKASSHTRVNLPLQQLREHARLPLLPTYITHFPLENDLN